MTTLFVESAANQMLLERLLADLAPAHRLQIIHTDGPDEARARARKHLLTRRAPVVLVLDAGTPDALRVQRQQRELEDYMRWGGMQIPYAVVQFVPEAEVVFFENPAVLERLLGRALAPELAEAGRWAPRKMLSSLEKGALGGYPTLLNLLREQDLNELRRSGVVKEIRSTIMDIGEFEYERRTYRAS